MNYYLVQTKEPNAMALICWDDEVYPNALWHRAGIGRTFIRRDDCAVIVPIDMALRAVEMSAALEKIAALDADIDNEASRRMFLKCKIVASNALAALRD